MEKVLVLFSIPIFLTLVFLIAVFVLAHYSGDEQAKRTVREEMKAQEKTEGTDSLVR